MTFKTSPILEKFDPTRDETADFSRSFVVSLVLSFSQSLYLLFYSTAPRRQTGRPYSVKFRCQASWQRVGEHSDIKQICCVMREPVAGEDVVAAVR